MNALDRFFGVSQAGSTLRREVVGGITTFATMSYIVFVQPTVLSVAGMDFGSVLLATCLSSAFSCFLMGFYARYPIALAPGMGENFLFAFTICMAMSFSWQAGLAIVFISSLLLTILLFFKVREKILAVLPNCLTNSIGPAIGMFIGFIGLQWGGIVRSNPATMVMFGGFHSGPALITACGVVLIAVLYARGFRGCILVGLLATCALALATGVLPWTHEPVTLTTDTFFNMNFGELAQRLPAAATMVFVLLFLALFDTVGTLVGVGTQAGLVKEDGTMERAGRAFQSDAIGSCVGAMLGTSTITCYIESSTGVAAGARTGLAAVVTGICFLFAIALAPLVHLAGQDIGPAFYGVSPEAPHVSMYLVVAPALVFVGFLMMEPLRKVKWGDPTESLPAFLTISVMVFGYAITEGIAAGCVSYAVLKLLSGRTREVHPVMYAVALLLMLRYAFLMQ